MKFEAKTELGSIIELAPVVNGIYRVTIHGESGADLDLGIAAWVHADKQYGLATRNTGVKAVSAKALLVLADLLDQATTHHNEMENE